MIEFLFLWLFPQPSYAPTIGVAAAFSVQEKAPPAPEKTDCCSACKGTGSIKQGDGHVNPCPCPPTCACKKKVKP